MDITGAIIVSLLILSIIVIGLLYWIRIVHSNNEDEILPIIIKNEIV